MGRKRGKAAREKRNTTVWGVPLASKEKASKKPKPRSGSVNSEKVRKRVAELLGTTEGARAKSPAKKTPERVGANKPGQGAQHRKKGSAPAGPTTWKCPNCLARIDVEKGSALVLHLNARGERCRGSGYQLPQRSTDALDHRVAGSFEGGRSRR